MAQRHRTAVHIHLLRIEPELARHRHRRNRERFVQLNQIDLTRRPPSLLEQLTHGFDRRHHHESWLNSSRRLRNDSRHRFDTELTRASQRSHYNRRRTIVNTGRVASSHCSLRLERGLQFREHFRRRVFAHRLVSVKNECRAFLLRHLDRHDFIFEFPRFDRGRRFAMRVDGKLVLLASADPIFVSYNFPGAAHVVIFKRTPKSIVDHRIDQLTISESITFARSCQQVRRVAHRLHAARDDDLSVAELHSLRRHHHRFQTRATHLVHSHCGNCRRYSSLQCRLPRGILSQACLNHTSHDHFINVFRLHARALHALAHNDRAQLRRGKTFQRSQKLSHRRARRADDYCFVQFRHFRTPYVRLGPILDFISLFIKHAGTHSCGWQRYTPSPFNSLHSETYRSDLQPAVSPLSNRHVAARRH